MTAETGEPPDSFRHGPISGGAVRAGTAAAVAALVALALAAALVWTALHRGPWYDEFYTWFVTRPDRPFAEGLRQSWLVDNHPPLFDVLAWAGAHLARSIETLRLLNLAALAATLAGGWAMVRHQPRYWTLTTLLLLMLAANETALRSGAELRSYFMSCCAGALVVLALAVGWLEGGLARRGQRLVLWAALLIGFNLHILTSLIIGALLVPFMAMALLRERQELLRQILAPALAGGLLFAAISAVQVPLWQTNTARFWIPAGFDAARWAIEFAVLRAAEANLLVLAGGLCGAALLAWQAWRDRRPGPALECMALLGAGVALSAALLIGLHLLRPVVMERYVAALVPAVALGVALGCDAALRRLPRQAGTALLVGAAGLTAWALAGNAVHTAARNSWTGTAQRLAALQQACPDSPVHIDPPYWNAYTLSLPPADNRTVMAGAYALMARRHHIGIEPAASRRIAPACPTLFWAEHDTSRLWDEAGILAHLRAQGFAIDRVWQYRIGDGWIAANRPLDAAPPAR